jgi:hypothetical protein
MNMAFRLKVKKPVKCGVTPGCEETANYKDGGLFWYKRVVTSRGCKFRRWFLMRMFTEITASEPDVYSITSIFTLSTPLKLTF